MIHSSFHIRRHCCFKIDMKNFTYMGRDEISCRQFLVADNLVRDKKFRALDLNVVDSKPGKSMTNLNRYNYCAIAFNAGNVITN